MKDFLIEKLPQRFRRNESKGKQLFVSHQKGIKSIFPVLFSESLIADPNCPSELIKNKKWNEIARQAIQGDLKLADMNGQKEAYRKHIEM